MIVELCGAPASGKSTTARLLTDALRAQRYEVELISSYRPAEAADHLGPVAVGVRRLTRPIWEALNAALKRMNSAPHDPLVTELLHLLPPRQLFESARQGLYLLRLLWSWERASRESRIVVFDQAFVQALATLIVLTDAADPAAVEQAVVRIPRPDLLFRVHAPEALLRARLRKRTQRQSRFERLLEPDIASNLRFVPALDDLCALYERHVAPVLPILTQDVTSWTAALTRICAAATAPLAALDTTRAAYATS